MDIVLRTVVIDCLDAIALSDFYSRLLGWPKTAVEPNWVLMRNPGGGTGLSFQSEAKYAPPVWPETDDLPPTKMLHLDFLVKELSSATERALALGATLSPEQSLQGVTVLMDPAGHPFCLFEDPGFKWSGASPAAV